LAKQCKSLSELKLEILKHVQQGLKENVAEVVKNEEVNQIREVVYNAYEPKQYERRETEGGLADKDNMESNIIGNEDGCFLMVTNKTTGNPEYGSEEVFTAPIVESGNDGGYGYYDYGSKNAAFMKPRPFQRMTLKELKTNKKHVDALEIYLKQVGFIIK
jgi:hypothetical protein